VSTPRPEVRAACLAAILAVFVGATLIAAPGAAPVGDEAAFLHFARQVAHGVYASSSPNEPMAFLWHGPGLPALLAPLAALHLPLVLMRLVGPLLLFGAVLAFERLLRLWVSPTRALIGACALGLYFPFWDLLPSLHKEPLALLLIIAGLHEAIRYLRGGQRRHGIAAGVVLGLLALTRLEFGTVLVVGLAGTVAWALTRRRAVAPRRFAVVLLVALAVCLPWLSYTYAKTGRPLYWGNAGGLSLYWMSTPASDELGDWHAVPEVFSDPNLARHRAFFHSLERLAPLQRDLALQRVATRNIQRHPFKYGENLLANVSRLWLGFPRSFRGPPPVAILYVLLSGLLLAGLLRLAVRTLRGRQRISVEAVPFLLLGGGALAVHLPFSAEPRMLAPIVPLMLCGLVCTAWPARARERRLVLRDQRNHARRPRAAARDLQWEAGELEPARG
jgi:4-amino-4-deoxy-L-arabinose transferase-like glycosyltransferase